MKRALWIVIAAAVAVVLFNISRFWYLSLWPRHTGFGTLQQVKRQVLFWEGT